MIVRADARVDRHKLLSEGPKEPIPVWGCVLPVDGLIVRSPPKGRLIFEEGSCELDSVSFGDGSEDAKLLHLEDPCFQGLRFLATEWWWAVWFDTRGCLDLDLGYLDCCDLVSMLLKFVILGGELLSQCGKFCLDD